MKKTFISTSAAFTLVACAASGQPASVGMANPASEYCAKQGGRVEIKQDDAGNQYGLCHLPDGRVVEEWALYRSQNGK
ncbi:Putative hemolysin [Neisseria zoodegmatis]|uniref:Hemolysin n=1 Tax=Neisseria zoodegmatis TaxID=326523 RepID=A0A378WVE2_9NEIS|nr:DUF333 domain-containing protein [Neisseria zoodegmatis]SUA44595.1 Putative hemolysin [Neisseria zoodegmatis]